MKRDLDLTEEEREISRTMERFAGDHAGAALAHERAGRFPLEAWKRLAELGVLALGAAQSEGGAGEIAAAMEPLGACAFPGPLVATFVAGRLVDDDERARIASGDPIASIGCPPLFAWADVADRFVVVGEGAVWIARARGDVSARVECVATLGGEPFGEALLGERTRIADAIASVALDLGDIALAAYLVGAGVRLVEAASEHARTRVQFGRAIGDFQAVAHPLASAAMRLRAARALVRHAARAWREAFEPARARGAAAPAARVVAAAAASAAAARLSATRAALDAAAAATQTFGALGVMAEGPVFPLSRRIRHLASAMPGRDRSHKAVLARLEGP